MNYYYAKKIENINFEEAIEKTKAALKEEGFGVLTEIDIKNTLKEKIDVDFRPYVILGACKPQFAHKALQAEDKIGTMLPCNVIVQQLDDSVEVAAVNPAASMQVVENEDLTGIASQVENKLQKVIDQL